MIDKYGAISQQSYTNKIKYSEISPSNMMGDRIIVGINKKNVTNDSRNVP